MADKSEGLKRIRIIAALVATAIFAVTAVGQFQGQPFGVLIVGAILSAAIGYSVMWLLLTIVIYLIRLFRR